MSRLGQNLGWGAALALAGAVTLGLRQAGPTTEAQTSSGFGETLPPNVTLRLKNVSIVGRAGGQPAWSLRADRVDSTRQQDSVEFAGSVAAHFLQSGRERAEVKAPRAVYRVREKQVQASGGVLCRVLGDGNAVKGQGDLRIQTPDVTWNIGARQIRCPGRVQVAGHHFQASGVNFVVDLVTRDYTLHKFNATFQIDGDDADTLPLMPPLSETP